MPVQTRDMQVRPVDQVPSTLPYYITRFANYPRGFPVEVMLAKEIEQQGRVRSREKKPLLSYRDALTRSERVIVALAELRRLALLSAILFFVIT